MSDSFASIRKLFEGGGILLFGLVLELGISFVAKLIIAKELGRIDYGTVSLGVTTAAIGSTLVLLGLKSGIGRYLPRYKSRERRRGVLISGFSIAIPLATLMGTAIIFAAPWLAVGVFGEQKLVIVFRIFGLAVPFGAVMKLSIGAIQGMQDSIPRVLVQNITFPVARFAGIAVALLLGGTVLGISLAYLLSYIAAAVVSVYYLYVRTDIFDRTISYEPMQRELLRFSFPLVITAAMTIVLSDIDMYMLGFFRGPGVVGNYNVAYPLAQLLTTALGAFGFIFMPVVSELDASDHNEQLHRLFQIVTKWIVMATFPVFIALFVFPDYVIGLTFGSEYIGAAPALSVLSSGFFIHTIFGLNKNTLTSLGHVRIVMYDDIIAAGTNVVLNLFLIPQYGLVGAAYATTASYAVMNGLYSVQLYRRTGLQPFTTALLRPLFLGLASIGIIYGLAQKFLIITPPILAILLLAFGVVYFISILQFGIEEEEVRIVLSVEEKFGIDLGPLKTIAKLFI